MNRPLAVFAVLSLGTFCHAQERILIDFGLPAEISPAPDLFGKHWNNVSALATASLSPLAKTDGTASAISLSIPDAFGAISTNTEGGETIYTPAATGDFFYVTKGGNDTGVLRLEGLDPTGATVYDLKFFVSSNRVATDIYATRYRVAGLETVETTLVANDNVRDVASVNGVIADASGHITITVTPDESSAAYGGIGTLDIAARASGSTATPDPQPNRMSEVGGTPNPPATAGPGNPEGLRAYVYEAADTFSGRVGLGESLRRAGFHVMPLPLDQPPYVHGSDPETDVDLIAFGSFSSQTQAYKDYMAAYADDLDDYIDRAGLLFQFAQADQDELKPPFLPDTQDATRSDIDHEFAHILSPGHLLLKDVPVSPDGKTLDFTLGENAIWYQNNVQWEAFVQFFGFQVILSGDTEARFPGLMEGAYGQGRFFVSAIAVDKIIDGASGADTTSQSQRDFNEPFFRNLYDYAALTRDRQTPPLELTPQPGTSLIEDGSWTLVLLPDTQIYSQNYPGIFESQTSWILNNARTRNIRYVLHLGDIVNVNSIPEWENARRSMAALDGKVPYALVPGNHDYGPGGNAATRDTFLNDYFHEDYYGTWPTFGGAMEEDRMDNTYHLFEAGGVKWIVMCLEWGPRDSTIAWADGIMSQHPDRKGILVTHAYMNNNDLRYDHTDPVNPQAYNPHNYQTPGGVNDGEELWQKLVRKHNFVLTVNGHVLGDGTGYRVDDNDAGQPVHQMLANYQFRNLGGEGYLRTLEFQPDNRTVNVKSYSSIYDNYLLAADQNFSFEIDLGAADSDGDGVFDYFDPDLDSDGDGVNNHDEFVLHGTSSSSADSDGDGLSDAAEIAAGTNPLSNDKKTIDAVKTNRHDLGLYTETDLREARPGNMLLEVEEGEVKFNFRFEESDSLDNDWSPLGTPFEWSVPAEDDRKFYRLNFEDTVPE